MIKWKKIKAIDLDVDYALILNRAEEKEIFKCLEEEVEYFKDDLARVKVFGKWHPIRRKQASYGDPGLSYKYSGNVIPAVPWTPTLMKLRRKVQEAAGHDFNFVLVNRYKDGDDYMGEHKDDEKELEKTVPIASLSLGAARDFVFRHQNTRRSNGKPIVGNVKLLLEPGSLLLMNPPTNQFWYHSLPKRRTCRSVRINLTFRKIRLVS